MMRLRTSRFHQESNLPILAEAESMRQRLKMGCGEKAQKQYTLKKEVKTQKPLTFRLHLSFNSLTKLHSFLSRPVKGERKAFACCDSGLARLSTLPLRVNSESPSTLSDPNMHPSFLGKEGPWPYGSPQSAGKSATTSLDQSCQMTSKARHSLLCSYTS